MGDEACSSTAKCEIFKKMEPKTGNMNVGLEDLNYGEMGYFKLKSGDFLDDRFQIIKMLGRGHFSTVWLGWDVSGGHFVALKISRYGDAFDKAAANEHRMLDWIHKIDPLDKRRTKIIQLPRVFHLSGERGKHLCLVYDEIGKDAYGFMLKHHATGLPLQMVKSIIRQVLEGLDFVHIKCKIIHTDIKPENVLICMNDSQIRRIADEAALSVPKIIKYWALPIPPSPEELTEDMKEGKSIEQSVQIENEKGIFKMKNSEKTSLQDMTLKTNIGETSEVKNDEKEKQDKSAENEGEKDVDYSQKIVSYLPNEILQPSVSSMKSSEQETFDQQVDIKILDFGNACQVRHVLEKIQTRHYRAPEVLIGAKYNTSADIWSVACMAFELATGEVLFNPPIVEGFSIDEIHIGVIMRLLGEIPKSILKRGTKSHLYFEPSGNLKNVDILSSMDLYQKLVIMYAWSPANAKQFSDFLLTMLHYDTNLRATASECLRHPWLNN